METIDLHDEFVGALHRIITKRADLVSRISDILQIEKESASRRLNRKVHFSVREMGLLSDALNISVDRLLRRNDERLWVPFLLESPLQYRSMEEFYDMVELKIDRITDIARDPAESGNIYHTLPMEFYMYSPLLLKFMFFKWGHYFVGSEEFNNFSQWEVPERVVRMKAKLETACNFDRAFYVWDNTLIWTLGREIENFRRMHVVGEDEKEAIVREVKNLLTRIERTLNGNDVPEIMLAPEMDFYVSSMNIGFTANYFVSEKQYAVALQTNFSFSDIDDCYESFNRLKEWIKSLRNISILLSGSGRIERRLFFERQHKIIDGIS